MLQHKHFYYWNNLIESIKEADICYLWTESMKGKTMNNRKQICTRTDVFLKWRPPQQTNQSAKTFFDFGLLCPSSPPPTPSLQAVYFHKQFLIQCLNQKYLKLFFLITVQTRYLKWLNVTKLLSTICRTFLNNVQENKPYCREQCPVYQDIISWTMCRTARDIVVDNTVWRRGDCWSKRSVCASATKWPLY